MYNKKSTVFNNKTANIYTVSKKTAPLRHVGIKSVIFQIRNFILNKSCEFYYDDVTMTSFIKNK